MLLYLVKMFGIQLGGLIIYYALLRNATLFSHSRKFLWVVLLSSFVVPFIPSTYFSVSHIGTTVDELTQRILLPEINVALTSTNTVSIYDMLISLYVLIALVSIFKLCGAYSKIVRLKNRTSQRQEDILLSKEITLPFSFLNWIFIPTSFVGSEDLPLIIAHEKAHVRMRHSWDKIIITLLSSAFWINPLLRLFHKELELIHEFQVDKTVIEEYPKEKYLATLLQTTIYSKRNSICLTHSFFSSPIKNRIIMLHKKSKNPLLKKTLSGLAILAVLVGFLSLQSTVSTAQVSTQQEVNPPVPPPPPPPPPAPPIDDIVEQASFPGGMEALIKYMTDNLKYPKDAKNAGMTGKLFVEFTVEKDGSVKAPSIIQIEIRVTKKTNADEKKLENKLRNEAFRVVKAMPKWNPAIKEDGTAVKSKLTLPITFEL